MKTGNYILTSFFVFCAAVAVLAEPAEGETLYAQSVLHEIGDWVNVNDLLGAPDGRYAYTANSDTTDWTSKSDGAAVWLDFGRTVHSGTIVVYHDDPHEHYTNLGVGLWHSYYPAPGASPLPREVPLASDPQWHGHCANVQGSGIVTCYTATRDFRYLRLDHFTTDPDFQDGIDAVAVIEGDAPEPGIYIDPPPEVAGPPVNGVAQWNNGYWSNPGAILGAPDGVYAWSSNPSHTAPRIIVDLGRVVYSGHVVIHHNKPYPGVTSLTVSMNSQEYDPEPDTCPDMLAPFGEGWELLTNGHGPSGVCTLQFPPTHFRYIRICQTQCSPGQEDGIDAVEVYESPVERVTRLASYYSQGFTKWCRTTSVAMLLDQYNAVAEYDTHSESVKPWDLAALLELHPWEDVDPFLGSLRLINRIREKYGVTLENKSYTPQWDWQQWRWEWPEQEVAEFWEHLQTLLGEDRAVLAGFGWPVMHAVVIAACEGDNVLVSDPSPAGTLVKYVQEDEPDPGMYELSKEQLCEILRTCIAGTLCWVSEPEPDNTIARASTWMEDEGLFFVDVEQGQISLELAWNGKYRFGYMYKPERGDWHSRLRHHPDKILGFAALPEEALGLRVKVANASPCDREFTISVAILWLENGSVCFEGQTEPFVIKGCSWKFIRGPQQLDYVPLIVNSPSGLIRTNLLPVEELAPEGGPVTGEYLLCVELHSNDGFEDELKIRFNVQEPAGRRDWRIRGFGR